MGGICSKRAVAAPDLTQPLAKPQRPAKCKGSLHKQALHAGRSPSRSRTQNPMLTSSIKQRLRHSASSESKGSDEQLCASERKIVEHRDSRKYGNAFAELSQFLTLSPQAAAAPITICANEPMLQHTPSTMESVASSAGGLGFYDELDAVESNDEEPDFLPVT